MEKNKTKILSGFIIHEDGVERSGKRLMEKGKELIRQPFMRRELTEREIYFEEIGPVRWMKERGVKRDIRQHCKANAEAPLSCDLM